MKWVDEKELTRHQAAGDCPHCGGKVAAVVVQQRWSLCFVQIGFVIKRKYICSSCSKRLVLYS